MTLNRFLILISTSISFGLAPIGVRGQTAGTIEPGFNPTLDFPDGVSVISVQGDGKILIAGAFHSVDGIGVSGIARLDKTGALDPTFNASLETLDVNTGPQVASIAVQSDGKVLVGGFFERAGGRLRNNIARLNSDGSLDATFDPGSGVEGTVQSIAPLSDGSLFVAGQFTSVDGQPRSNIARLNGDGSLIAAPVGSGANSYVRAVAVQSDGKILICGGFISVDGHTCRGIARLNTDTSLDVSFHASTPSVGGITSMAVQEDGSIVVGGDFNEIDGKTHRAIARLNPNGSVQSAASFKASVSGFVDCLALQPDGKIVIVGPLGKVNGQSFGRIMARLNQDGSLEYQLTFNPPRASLFNNPSGAMAIQSDGKILLGGFFSDSNSSYQGVARFFNDGGITSDKVIFMPLAEELGDRLHSAFLLSSGEVVTSEVRHNPTGEAVPNHLTYFFPDSGQYAQLTFSSDGSVKMLSASGGYSVTYSYLASPLAGMIRISATVRKSGLRIAVMNQDVAQSEFDSDRQSLLSDLQQTSPALMSSAALTYDQVTILRSAQLMLKIGGVAISVVEAASNLSYGNLPLGFLNIATAVTQISDIVDTVYQDQDKLDALQTEMGGFYDATKLSNAIFNMRRNGASFSTVLTSRIRNLSFYGQLFNIADAFVDKVLMEANDFDYSGTLSAKPAKVIDPTSGQAVAASVSGTAYIRFDARLHTYTTSVSWQITSAGLPGGASYSGAAEQAFSVPTSVVSGSNSDSVADLQIVYSPATLSFAGIVVLHTAWKTSDNSNTQTGVDVTSHQIKLP